MTKVISKLYPTYERASQAVRDLETAGVPHKEISIVANNADSWYSDKPVAKRVDRAFPQDTTQQLFLPVAARARRASFTRGLTCPPPGD